MTETCSRDYSGGACDGELFLRTSRSGLTQAWICEFHAGVLESQLDSIASRYPEVNHSPYCTCWGCSDGSY